jgi:uncharacterized protein YbcI
VTEAQQRESVTLLVSNEMVRIYKDLLGRGPTRATTAYAGPDTLLCTLERTLTTPELNMAELGEHHRLREMRMFFQHAREAEFRAAVEGATGRKVRAFASGMDTVADVSAEVFYLHPIGFADGAAP